MLPAFFGLSGESLTPDEIAFFKDADPAGYILFKRNCTSREQLLRLTDSLRELSGRANAPILIDQEGGRVARLQPPEWPEFPKAELFSQLYRAAPATAIEAIRLNAKAIGLVLSEVGVNVNCLPLLDVQQAGAHDIIGDRALGAEPMQVAALGKAVLDGMAEAGVVGVVKHIPGHGRALADSHVELPVVDVSEDALEIDLEPFITLHNAPMGMTSHVVYTAWDDAHCASLSRIVIEAIIRGRIGFDGLLMSDDLGMHALKDGFDERAGGVIEAGCDIALHCSGDMNEMIAVASAVGEISDKSARRLRCAMESVSGSFVDADLDELFARRDALLTHA